MGVGLFDAWRDIETFIEVTATVEPDAKAHRHYQELFRIYRDLYRDLKPRFTRLAQIEGGEISG